MSIAALIVAAGRGSRAGGELPKQWQLLAGARVIDHTLAAFVTHPEVGRIVVAVHPDDMARAKSLQSQGVTLALGGADRAQSVRNGLTLLQDETSVLIHDGARPCVTRDVIDGVIMGMRGADGAAPGLAVTDALWRGEGGRVAGIQDRRTLYSAQTPQGFKVAAITAAYAAYDGPAADDVTFARAAGMHIAITTGHANNIKITTHEDFARAAQILESAMDIRTGNGFDVHAFGPGDHVVLCGVKILHDQGLVGHSDADVGMHTITDAIYGGLARGDIGQHFPPSDPQWKGARSHIFLRHAVDLAAGMGFSISHIDCTLICEQPKVGPHAADMRAALGQIMELDVDRISVKATTSERLGFTGRGEGIACMATATLVKI